MPALKNFSVNKKNNSLLKVLTGTAVFLSAVFFLNIFILPIKNYIYAVSYPMQKTFFSAGESSSSFLGSLLNAGNWAKENQDLRNKNQMLLSQVAALQSIVQGNQAQSDISVTCENNGFKFVMAGVTGLDNDILSLNKGSADGVSEGMPVISGQNVLYGKVLKVYRNFSDVLLISNKASNVIVKVQNDDSTIPEVTGMLKGKGGLGSYLDLVPINSELTEQGVLVTSAIDKSFPKDLLIGQISGIKKDDQKQFQQAGTNLFLDIKSSDHLFVITNFKSKN